MTTPKNPKIYHIVHLDNLNSIINDNCLWPYSIMQDNPSLINIGVPNIKQRRLEKPLTSHPNTFVGEYVPFYFCYRSIMLYLIYRSNNPGLEYRGGQQAIIHLEADLKSAIHWAENNNHIWAFTLSNAGSSYFIDYADLKHLDKVNWNAVKSHDFRDPAMKEGKQAEFLMEKFFPWDLVERIGVYSENENHDVIDSLRIAAHKPVVIVEKNWYY